MIQVVNSYLEHTEFFEGCKRLRREIRIATRGAPLTEAIGSVNDVFLSDQNEQLYAAQTLLLKKAYRFLARITHPDQGGDAALFHEVTTAYRLRNLTQLTALYVSLTKEKDALWPASNEAWDYISQELKRPGVESIALRGVPEFGIMQAHMTGRKDRAVELADAYTKDLYFRLTNELHFILRKNNGKGIEEVEGRGQEEQEAQGPQGSEVREGQQSQEEKESTTDLGRTG